MMQLGKCLRNKGAGKGVTVFDGCQAFSPKPKKPQMCEACGCHASFHQRLDGSGADSGVLPGGIASWNPLIGVNPDEVPIIPRRSQPAVERNGGGNGRKAGHAHQKQADAERAVRALRALWGGQATGGSPPGLSSVRLDYGDGATSGGAPNKSRGRRKGELTIAETAAQLGLTVDPNYPGEGKRTEPTIAQMAAQRGLKLGAARRDRNGGKDARKGKRAQTATTIAERAGELGMVLPGGVSGAGVSGRGALLAPVIGRIPEWASVVDLTEGEATRGGGKRRTREDLAGPAKKARAVPSWMQTAPETSGQSPLRGGTTSVGPTLAEVRNAPAQQGEGAGSAKKGGRPKDSKPRAKGWEEPGAGGATSSESKYTAFGDGILFARQMLADFVSQKTSCEKDLAFKEVGHENKHLMILRSQLGRRTVSDMLDARSSTKKIIAYLAKDEKERVALTQPLGTIRVVTERPFYCERRPAVTEWLEGRSLSTHVAELSYLYAFPQYRNGAVTIPLFAHVYLRILKPAGVNCVLLSMMQTQVERYLLEHLFFLGFEYIEKAGSSGSVLALNLEKAAGLLLT